jgi:hypothetical protein
MTNLKTALVGCCLVGCALMISCGDEPSSSPSVAGAAGLGGRGNAAGSEATSGADSANDGGSDAAAHTAGRSSGGPAVGGSASSDVGGEGGAIQTGGGVGPAGSAGRTGGSGAPNPPATGGSQSNSGGAAGASDAGSAGAASGAGGTDAQGGGGGAGPENSAECAEIGVPEAAVWTVADSKTLYFAEATPNLADPSQPDYLLLQFYDPEVGTFTLGQGVDASADTCDRCLLAFVDLATAMTPGPTRAFFAISGTLTVSATSMPQDGVVDALATDLTLVEVDSTTQAPLPDGDCLHVGSVHVLSPALN